MIEAQSTQLAKALSIEAKRCSVATAVSRDVLCNALADDATRDAALALLEWLTMPAEKIAKWLVIRDTSYQPQPPQAVD